MGVERFFLYDNFSIDDHREVLAPYVESGVVVIHDWPVLPGPAAGLRRLRSAATAHESRWIAFIDLDEFLFSPAGDPLPDVLARVRAVPRRAGQLGHLRKRRATPPQPPGLVIENYLMRCEDEDGPQQSKSIVDPSRAERCGGAHFFLYKEGSAVDERHRPVPYGRTEPLAGERLRVNHYYTKSLAEGKAEAAHGDAPTTGDDRARPRSAGSSSATRA